MACYCYYNNIDAKYCIHVDIESYWCWPSSEIQDWNGTYFVFAWENIHLQDQKNFVSLWGLVFFCGSIVNNTILWEEGDCDVSFVLLCLRLTHSNTSETFIYLKTDAYNSKKGTNHRWWIKYCMTHESWSWLKAIIRNLVWMKKKMAGSRSTHFY